MFFPISGSFIVTRKTLFRRALKNSGIQPVGRKSENIHKIFPCPVNSLFLEVIAKTPVAKHLEHGVVICIHSHLLKVVMLAGNSQTFL